MNPQFDHEKLDVYRVAIEFVAWAETLIGDTQGLHGHRRDQLCRSAQSIPLNIAEGIGKRSTADRKRFLEIACGSAMESAASLDVLVAVKLRTASQTRIGKDLLFRVVSMLTKMTKPETNIRS
jgi:four helix bundle protein